MVNLVICYLVIWLFVVSFSSRARRAEDWGQFGGFPEE
jgi:hypothetical protein